MTADLAQSGWFPDSVALKISDIRIRPWSEVRLRLFDRRDRVYQVLVLLVLQRDAIHVGAVTDGRHECLPPADARYSSIQLVSP